MLGFSIMKMGVLPLFTISVVLTSLISLANSAPKTDPVRIAYSISESKPLLSGRGPTIRLKLPLAESTLPHAPVLREMSDSEHDMSTSTPSSESLESQLQSPHIVRKKALVDDFDTSGQVDDLLQFSENV